MYIYTYIIFYVLKNPKPKEMLRRNFHTHEMLQSKLIENEPEIPNIPGLNVIL